jgi:hypothetical protein
MPNQSNQSNQLSQNDPNAFTNPNQNFGASQAQIALQQQMAKQMLADSGNVQFANVTPGGSVRGAGGGSVPAGGWVVQNKYAGVQALGDKLAGLYMAKQAGQNQADSNQAAMQALQSVMGGGQGNAGDSSASAPQAPPTDIAAPQESSPQAATPVPGINPDGSQAIPQSAPQSQPQPQGNPAQKVASAYVQPQNAQQLSTLMRLAQAPGVTGQLAASMLSKQLSPPDPALVNAALAERKSTDPSNAGAVSNLNSLEQLARMPISSADALRGEKNTDSEKATIADTQSQTQFRNGPQTAKENADASSAAATASKTNAEIPFVAPTAAADIASKNASAGAATASAASTRQKTGLEGASASADANTELVAANRDLDADTRAAQLVAKLKGNGGIGGKPIATLADLQNAVGDNPEFAELKGMLSVDALKSVREGLGAGNRLNKNEYEQINPSQINANMPVDAIDNLLAMKTKYDTIGVGIAQGKANTTSAVTGNPATNLKPNVPTIGTVQKGYVFVGGDPKQQSSWAKVNQ